MLLRNLSPLLALLVIAGCASSPRSDDLTVATETQGDFAPRRGEGRELPVTTQTADGVSFSLNLQEETSDGTSLYWVRLLVRNLGEEPLEGEVTCDLADKDGVAVPVIPKDAVMQLALTTANGGPGGVQQAASYAGLAGTAAGLAGAPVPGLGFVGPAAALFASNGGGDRRDAAARAQWALTHWMPESLTLEGGSARGGLLAFAAPRPRPLTVTITFAGRAMRVTTQ